MSRRTSFYIVALLTLLGAVLRVPGLNSGLWFDEIVTLVESVRPPLHQVVTAFPGNNNHPLYSLLANLSVNAFYEHPWTLRLPAFAFGVLSIPLLYALATAVTSRAEALLATLLLTVSYHHVWFSQNARAYTMLLAFTLLATLLLVRLLRQPDRRHAGWYGLAVGLGIYAHLTMAFVAAAHFIIWAWEIFRAGSGRDRRERTWVAGVSLGSVGVVALLLYLPMLLEVYAFFSGPPQATAAVATSQWAALEMIKGLQVGFGFFGVAAALALIAVGGLSYLKHDPLLAFIFALPGGLTGAAMVLLHAPIRPRFFFMFIGFGLLMLVRGAMDLGRAVQQHLGLRALRNEAVGVMAVLALAVTSAASLEYNYRYPKQDFEGAMRYVDNHRFADEPVATAGLATYPFASYHRRDWMPIQSSDDLRWLRAGTNRTWVVYSFPEYMDPTLVAVLTAECATGQAFRGTLGGGAVVVCVAPGTKP